MPPTKSPTAHHRADQISLLFLGVRIQTQTGTFSADDEMRQSCAAVSDLSAPWFQNWVKLSQSEI